MNGTVKYFLHKAAPAFLRLSPLRQPRIIGLHNPTPQNLESILRQLSRLGEFVPYGQMVDGVLSGRHPSGGLIITFDDGYQENMRILDVLEAFSCRAMFFVNSACLDSPRPLWFMNVDDAESLKDELRRLPYETFLREIDRRGLTRPSVRRDRFGLTSAELKKIHGRGHDIGIHTHSHVFLSSLTPAEIGTEILTCAERLKDALNQQDLELHVAYPDGDYDAKVIAAMKSLGVRTAVTTNPGSPADVGVDPLALPRVMLADDDYPGYCAFKVSRLYARLKTAKAA